MQNDSIETLLQRYCGEAAPIPDDLDRRLLASLRRSTAALQSQQQQQHRLQQRMSRRDAIRFAIRGAGNAGIGVLSMGAETLQRLEVTLTVQEAPVTRPARP